MTHSYNNSICAVLPYKVLIKIRVSVWQSKMSSLPKRACNIIKEQIQHFTVTEKERKLKPQGEYQHFHFSGFMWLTRC